MTKYSNDLAEEVLAEVLNRLDKTASFSGLSWKAFVDYGNGETLKPKQAKEAQKLMDFLLEQMKADMEMLDQEIEPLQITSFPVETLRSIQIDTPAVNEHIEIEPFQPEIPVAQDIKPKPAKDRIQGKTIQELAQERGLTVADFMHFYRHTLRSIDQLGLGEKSK